jgi:hypothetical protein
VKTKFNEPPSSPGAKARAKSAGGKANPSKNYSSKNRSNPPSKK